MLLRLDLHCHSRFSFDSRAEPEHLVDVARARGLHGFALTDHDTSEGVEYFLNKGHLREDGRPEQGLLIIPGQEISTSQGHLLALGLYVPDMKGVSPYEAAEQVQANGGIVVPPHPFDHFRHGLGPIVLRSLRFDALESHNGGSRFRKFNEMAAEYAEKRQLAVTGGSDAHVAEDLGLVHTELEVEEFTLPAILQALRAGAGRVGFLPRPPRKGLLDRLKGLVSGQ